MSRKTIGIWFAAYFLVAVVFGLFVEWRFERHQSFSVFAAYVIGFALVPYIMSGLIPMIFWAFRRFQAERAALPFIAWGFLGAALMGLATSGAFEQERQERIIRDGATGIMSLSGPDYDAFQRAFTKGCLDKQRSSQLYQKGGITERQIAMFCQCTVETLAKEFTFEEGKFFFANGHFSDSLREKADNVNSVCLRLVLGR